MAHSNSTIYQYLLVFCGKYRSMGRSILEMWTLLIWTMFFPLMNTANIITISYGTAVGWTSAALLVLESDDTPLETGPLRLSEVAWVAAIFGVGGTIGTLVGGWTCERFGRKPTLLISGLPMAVRISIDFHLLLYYYSSMVENRLTFVGKLFTARLDIDSVRAKSMVFVQRSFHIRLLWIVGICSHSILGGRSRRWQHPRCLGFNANGGNERWCSHRFHRRQFLWLQHRAQNIDRFSSSIRHLLSILSGIAMVFGAQQPIGGGWGITAFLSQHEIECGQKSWGSVPTGIPTAQSIARRSNEGETDEAIRYNGRLW